MSTATETNLRRGPWRPRETSDTAWRRRYLRRGLFTAFGLVLVVLLLLLLYRPFWHPNAKLVLVQPPEYGVGTTVPLAFPGQEQAGLESLRPTLFHGRGAAAPLLVNSLADVGDVQSLGDQLREIDTGRSDVLMLYIAAHGIGVNNRPYLMCQSFDATRPQSGLVPLDDLLRQVARSNARTKLLILDSGQLAYEPRLGVLINEFPRLLSEAIETVRLEETSDGLKIRAREDLQQAAQLRQQADQLRSEADQLDTQPAPDPQPAAPDTQPSPDTQAPDARQQQALAESKRLEAQQLEAKAEFLRSSARRKRNDANQRQKSLGLWVINSNSPFERAHVSHALQRTVFGYFVSQGLKGPADLDNNKLVDVGELHRFVATQVNAWVQRYTAGNETQLPMLLSSETAALRQDSFPTLVSITAFPKAERTVDLGQALYTARESSRLFAYLTNTNTEVSEYSVMMRASSPLYSTGAGSTLLRGYYASRYARQAARQIPPSAQPAGGAAGEPAGPEGTAVGEAAAGEKPAGGGEAEGEEGPKFSPLINEIGALLTEGWSLRDTLRQDVRLGSVARFAPHLLRRFEVEWLDLEAVFRSGKLADERAFAASLRRRLAIMRHLAGTASPDALPPDAVEWRAWTGVVLEDPAPHALGLREALAARRNTELPEELRKLIADLDRLATSGTRAEMQEWLGKLPATDAQYDELQLAAELAGNELLPWPLVQQAVRTRRQAQQVTSAHPRFIDWARETLEQADRLRLQGERTLHDKLGAGNDQYAASLLTKAAGLYDQAQRDMQLVREALEADLRLSQRLPYYSRWRSLVRQDAGGNAPSLALLQPLAASMLELAQMLDSTANARSSELPQLRRLVEKIQRQEALAAAGLEPAGIETLLEVPPQEGSSWRIEAILATPAPDVSLRNALMVASEQIDIQLTQRYQLPVIPPTTPVATATSPAQWAWLRQQAELEMQMCLLAARDLPAAQRQLEVVRQTWSVLQQTENDLVARSEDSPADESSWDATRQFGAALQQFYAQLPISIQTATRDNDDLRDADSRPERLAVLRAAARALHWLAPQDVARLGPAQPNLILQRTDYHDQWAWQIRRLRIAAAFATESELSGLASLAQRYGAPPVSLDEQPSLLVDGRPRLIVEAPSSLSLISETERELVVSLKNNGTEELACWVVMQYDPEVIRVINPAGNQPIYSEPPQVQANGSPQPIAPPTLTLAAGASKSLRLRVVRQPSPPRAGCLVIKTIADPIPDPIAGNSAGSPDSKSADQLTGMLPPAETPDALANTLAGRISNAARYDRQTVELQIPVPAAVALRVEGQPGTWSRVDSGYLLHPFPNRDSQFKFSLLNHSGRQRTVDVQLLALQQNRDVPLPDADLQQDLAERLLDQLGPATVLQSLSGVVLPADGSAVPLPIPGPQADQPGGAPAGTEATNAAGSAASSAAPPSGGVNAKDPAATGGEAAIDAPLAGPQITAGIVLVIQDRSARKTSLRRIEFAPQRPRRYVRATVGYNRNAEQLHVTVTPVSRELLPSGGVKIRAEFVETLPQNVQARLEGELKAPDYEATLYANIPAEPRRTVTLRLHVDNYPRAFVFRVPCGVHSRSIPEEDGLMQVRIVSPYPGQAFQAPVDFVRVQAEVDAPVGTFQIGSDVVEIGFDEDLDREFRGDSPLRFYSDRQADVRLVSLLPGGIVNVTTRVGDFVVDLPGRGLQNVRVNVLGRLFARKNTAWSLPIPIVLDAAPPQLARVKTASGNLAVIGQPLVVSVWGDGEDLSNLGGVEASFDIDRTGEFSAASPPVPGKATGDGRWEIALPTDGLTPGKRNVLLRARDRVGNAGKIQTYEVLAVTEAELQKQKETLVVVTGRVSYRQQPVPGATVSLEGADGKTYGPVTTNEQGSFRIDQVPVGKYKVAARGIVRNTPRFPKEPITLEVAEGDSKVKRLDIEILTNRGSEQASN